MRIIIVALCLLIAVACNATQVDAQQTKGGDERPPEIGELGRKLQTPMAIVGTLVPGPSKGYEGGRNVRVKKIDGIPTQSFIRMPIDAASEKPHAKPSQTQSIHSLEYGKTYELKGYETGMFVGGAKRMQDTGRYFRNEFVVTEAKEVPAITWAPSDFIDREALIAGTAKNENGQAIIEAADWKLALEETSPWEDWQIGKEAEAFGLIHRSSVPSTFTATKCSKRLVKLGDQIGKQVVLRGIAPSMNGKWWFNYRGSDIYVEGMDRQDEKWSKLEHWLPIELAGTLELSQDLSHLVPHARLTMVGNKCYVIKNSSWKPSGRLLEMETTPKYYH